jgi:3'5'-cyclic nucleotide phosphodiesterase
VDHPGVSNAQLEHEQHELFIRYPQSPAQQHAIDVAWNLLSDPAYGKLRNTIYETDSELRRFRQVLVHTTLATDLYSGRESRQRALWQRAFGPSSLKLTGSTELAQRRAALVLACTLQASHAAHTMQHWHVYRKWNERYFVECYSAYVNGRCGSSGNNNPAEDWYEGELQWFDHAILPLAHALRECQVFGVSGDEYLNYALRNRQEWERRGRTVVMDMVTRVSVQFPIASSSTTMGTTFDV